MKTLIFILFILVGCNSSGKELYYTASTPAGMEVKTFLGIPLKDSVDFIRWNLKLINLKTFTLSCSYGIGRPNTNGFIDEKNVELEGTLNRDGVIYTLVADGRSLSLLFMNYNLMHILDNNKSMLAGNGGWSYTLNSTDKIQTAELNMKPKNTSFTDSITFEGRTPCKEINRQLNLNHGSPCYKIKWLVRLYKDNNAASAGTYRIGVQNPRTGKWKMREDKAGKIIYSLDLNNGHTLDLLHADEKVVYLMDDKNGILVGDEDFSFSLNRRK
jgi:hypothetical protein